MIKYFVLIIAVVVIALPTAGQTIGPRDSMDIAVDYARFRGDKNELYVELYFAFPQRALTYVADSAGIKGGIDLTVLVASPDSIVYADRWLIPHTLTDTAKLVNALNLVSISNMMLPAGDYSLKVIGRDINNAVRTDSVELRMPIRMLDTDKIILSDLELASNITKGQEGTPFYKNTLEVVPNAVGVFGERQDAYFYLEAYNLLLDETKDSYDLKTAVYDAVGRELISRERPRRRVGESMVVVDKIDVSKLRSGTYTLLVSVLDSAKNPSTSSGKKFYVYNPALGVDSTLLRLDPGSIGSAYSGMSEEEIDKEFAWITYAASDVEREQYVKLKGVDAKRKYMSDFWRQRPLGLRDEYLKRVAHANEQYHVLGREGYKTDRGRVYIVYGSPDDIDRHPNDPGNLPYEIWYYNSVQGGVLFVFVLRQQGGEYELVHSTHRNELHDPNWARFATTN